MKIIIPKYKLNLIPIIYITAIYTRMTGQTRLWTSILVIIAGLLTFLRYKSVRSIITYILFLIICILPMIFQTIISVNDGTLSDTSIHRIVSFICMFYIGSLIGNLYSEEYIINGFKSIFLIGICASIYSIIEYFVRDNHLKNYMIEFYQRAKVGSSNYRVSSFFMHPIVYANFLLICIVINLYLNENKKLRNFYTALFTIALLFTMTRGAWLIFIGVVTCEIFTRVKPTIRKRSFYTLLFGVFFVALILLCLKKYNIDIVQKIVLRFSGLTESSSYIYRSSMSRQYLKLIFSSNIFTILFGNGFYASKNAMIMVDRLGLSIETTDNQWISLLYDGGIYILVIFIILLIYCVTEYFRQKQRLSKMLILMCNITLAEMFFFESMNWQTSFFFLLFPLSISFGKGRRDRTMDWTEKLIINNIKVDEYKEFNNVF